MLQLTSKEGKRRGKDASFNEGIYAKKKFNIFFIYDQTKIQIQRKTLLSKEKPQKGSLFTKILTMDSRITQMILILNTQGRGSCDEIITFHKFKVENGEFVRIQYKVRWN